VCDSHGRHYCFFFFLNALWELRLQADVSVVFFFFSLVGAFPWWFLIFSVGTPPTSISVQFLFWLSGDRIFRHTGMFVLARSLFMGHIPCAFMGGRNPATLFVGSCSLNLWGFFLSVRFWFWV